MPSNEKTPLVKTNDCLEEASSGGGGADVAAAFHDFDFAKGNHKLMTKLLGYTQLLLLLLFFFATSYSSKDYSDEEYIIFRDIMVMLLLGFGFLMTFLAKYGLGAVGFTMLMTVIAIQLNIFVEWGCRVLFGTKEDTSFPLHLRVPTLIDGEFAAATLLITFGAIIGRATPVQMVVCALCQSVFYAFNKVVIVLGLLGAEDVGGSITIHMFGAVFGLAVSYVLGPPKTSSMKKNAPNMTSDLTAFIGTTLLWVYWPSFVGATETGVSMNENVCVIHTVLALLGSTLSTFYLSQTLCHGKFEPVHIANSTLAGGVAVGSSARLAMTPGGAVALGVTAGLVSVYGYVYSSPKFEKLGVYDTCGVGNLHGWPSIVGGLASIIFVAIDPDADFLIYGALSQCLRQFGAVLCCVLVAAGTGCLTGFVMTKAVVDSIDVADEYDDGVWWEGEYFY